MFYSENLKAQLGDAEALLIPSSWHQQQPLLVIITCMGVSNVSK
jgi:hypothetical protein